MPREGTIGTLLVALAFGACGGDDGEEPASTPAPTAASESTPEREETATPEPSPEPVKLPVDEPFGPRCGQVIGASALRALRGGPSGQTSGLVLVSPKLKIMSAVLSQEDLLIRRGQTLFIPVNAAYNRLSFEGQYAVRANLQKQVAGHHVVRERLRADQIIGEHRTVARDTISVAGTGPDDLLVGGVAKVLCGNLRTEDSVVYVIDTILPPRGTPPFPTG